MRGEGSERARERKSRKKLQGERRRCGEALFIGERRCVVYFTGFLPVFIVFFSLGSSSRSRHGNDVFLVILDSLYRLCLYLCRNTPLRRLWAFLSHCRIYNVNFCLS